MPYACCIASGLKRAVECVFQMFYEAQLASKAMWAAKVENTVFRRAHQTPSTLPQKADKSLNYGSL
jgi:hypothetical protein